MRAAGEATRERILEVAKEEFARYGVAGARINRIAGEAHASKERMYAYFPSKEALFAAVFERLQAEVSEDTTLRGDDVPGYVGRLFDSNLRPDMVRFQDWLGLVEDGELADDDLRLAVLLPKLDELRRGQEAGHIDPAWDPVELLSLLIQIAKSMAAPDAVARKLSQVAGGSESTEARRRAAVDAARRLIAPRGGESASPAGTDRPGRI